MVNAEMFLSSYRNLLSLDPVSQKDTDNKT